ncbi:hypothetical protein ACS0TY_022946 [Phlomoides rotata]
MEKMKNIAFGKRSTIRRLARELNVSKSHVDRWVVIKAHTNTIKPELTIWIIINTNSHACTMYIPKVMFMSAVSMPQYACNRQLKFDGKI